MQEKVLLDRTYTDEELNDIEEHVGDALFYGQALNIPDAEQGFRRGTFKVTVIWMDDPTAKD